MTTPSRATTALRLRRSPWKYVVSISGGGSAFLSDYLSIPGASQTFLEGLVPYSPTATNDFLGFVPENYCSEKTARLLASAAFRRAIRLTSPSDPSPDSTFDVELAGVGATASLVSDRPKKGGRRIHCAVQTFFQTFSATLTLQNGSRTRLDEERLAADFIASTLLFATERAANPLETANDSKIVGREFSATLPLETGVDLTSDDVATVSWTTADSVGASLFFDLNLGVAAPVGAVRFRAGKIDKIVRKSVENGERLNDEKVQNVEKDDVLFEIAPTIYPGSFNPPHRGHHKIAELAAEKTGAPVAFELSVRNVDKPPLDYLETIRRIAALQTEVPNVPVWATNAPRFVEKAELFPGSTVALGTDSLVRLADPRYEGDSVARRDAVLERFAALGTRFLVFSRKILGKIVSPDALDVPPILRERCEFVSSDDFLDDVSSTELRRNGRAARVADVVCELFPKNT